MRRTRIIAAVVLVGLILYSLAGFVVVPMVLKSELPKKLSALVHRPVTVQGIHFNPYTLTASVDGFEIREKTGSEPFVSFGRLFVNVTWRSIVDRGLVIQAVRLEKPFVHIDRIAGAKFNFSDLLAGKAPAEKPAAAKSKPSTPFRFAAADIRITDGEIVFSDTPLKKRHVFSHLEFSLPFVSNFEQYVGTYDKPQFQGRLNDTRVSVKMETKPFSASKNTVVDVDLIGIHIPYYLAYLPSDIGFRIDKGDLDVRSRIALEKKRKGLKLDVSGNVALSNFAMVDRNGKPILSLPKMAVKLASSHPLEGQVRVTSIRLDRPVLSVVREADGKINLLTLGSKTAAPETPAPAPATVNKTPTDKPPFRIDVDQLRLNDGTVDFTDLAAGGAHSEAGKPPVQFTLAGLQVAVDGFSNQPETPARFDVKGRINDAGGISTDGRFVLSPLSVQGRFGIEDARLAWAQPYLPENVRLDLKSGGLFASGDAAMKTDADGTIAASVKGKAAIRNVAVAGPGGEGDVVSWKDFSIDGIDVNTHPAQITIGKVSAVDLTGRIMRDTDGTLNLQKLVATTESPASEKEKKAAPPKPAPSEKSATMPITIGGIAMKNFGLRFTDKSVSPRFSTRLDLSSVRVARLSSQSFKAADITAKGKIGGYAPLSISGTLNPLWKDLFVNMKFHLANLDLGGFSPYSGKYIGRTIEQGKLNLSLDYRIDKKRLDAQNRVFMDQFTLGRDVNSPDAISLPVGTAVALLKDRDGEIKLDLPVSGRLDDPEFSVWGLVLQGLKNILVKAATSPFDLVASLVGGGPDMQYIEFPPGSAVITPESAKKIDAVDKLLFERPGLTMGLTGYVDHQKDRMALAREMLEKKIDALKLADLAKQGIPAPQTITVTPEERVRYLKELHDAEVAAQPKKKTAAKPTAKKALTADQMEKALEAEMPVTDNDLHQLAARRAGVVEDALLKDSRIAATRLFLVEAQGLTPPQVKGVPDGRVVLSIR